MSDEQSTPVEQTEETPKVTKRKRSTKPKKAAPKRGKVTSENKRIKVISY